jgi:hypothetical protein
VELRINRRVTRSHARRHRYKHDTAFMFEVRRYRRTVWLEASPALYWREVKCEEKESGLALHCGSLHSVAQGRPGLNLFLMSSSALLSIHTIDSEQHNAAGGSVYSI